MARIAYIRCPPTSPQTGCEQERVQRPGSALLRDRKRGCAFVWRRRFDVSVNVNVSVHEDSRRFRITPELFVQYHSNEMNRPESSTMRNTVVKFNLVRVP